MGKRNSGVTFVIHLLHVDADRAARTRVGLVSFIAEVTGEKLSPLDAWAKSRRCRTSRASVLCAMPICRSSRSPASIRTCLIRMTSHGTVAMTAVAFGFAQVKNERLIHVNAVLSTAAFCTAH